MPNEQRGFTFAELLVSLVTIPVALYIWLPAIPVQFDESGIESGPLVVDFFRLQYTSDPGRDAVAADVQAILGSLAGREKIDLFEVVPSRVDPGTYFIGVWRPHVLDVDIADSLRESLSPSPNLVRPARLVEVPTTL